MVKEQLIALNLGEGETLPVLMPGSWQMTIYMPGGSWGKNEVMRQELVSCVTSAGSTNTSNSGTQS